MQCPVCLTVFKNYNSYKVHRWRFHNPNTRYRQITHTTSNETVIPSQKGSLDKSLALPVVAASAGMAAVSHGDWKKALLLLLIIAGIVLIVWYLLDRASKEGNHFAN